MTDGSARVPTIRDVAERAGVSKSLVSLVLREAEHVSPAKRQAVLAAVDELGYRPNAAARSLSERRTRIIGVLLNDMRNPWFVELLDGLSPVLRESGLHVLLEDGRLNRRAGEDLTRTFTDLRADGVVVVGTQPDPDMVRATAERVPTVIAGTREPLLSCADIVANDDERGALLAAGHLIDLGHRRIAHIAGHGAVADLRRHGFEKTMHAHGLARSALIQQGDLTEEGGYRAAVRLLSAPAAERPTAIFAFNDIACIGALSAAEEMGLRVPEDLSLVGYDNTYLSRLRHLWLTTVDSASREVGRHAAQSLLERIASPAKPASLILAAPTLERRGTTAPPRPVP
jgi:DNA-binding LacI/PurR family transcriptional regulator